MQWFLLVSGIIVIIIALNQIMQQPQPNHESHHHHHSGIYWLLCAVSILLLCSPPPGLGANSITSLPGPPIDAATGITQIPFPPLPPGSAPEISLYEFTQRSFRDSTHSLNNHPVTLTGFVLHNRNGSTSLGRLMILCCAADARTLIIRLTNNLPQDPNQPPPTTNSWVKVVVTLVPGTTNDNTHYQPSATVHSWTSIPTPKNTYLY